MITFDDDYFMREALKEAKTALAEGEVPIGALIVFNNRIISKAHNMTERLNDATAHAEMLAITAAQNYTGSKYLRDCTLYVTIEPCAMCASAAYWSQISRIVFGASDPKKGFSLFNPSLIHPKTSVVPGILENECSEILVDFFKRKRF
jgi:tRNA(adenine34) deaminase